MMLAVAPIYDLNPCTSHRWVTPLGVGRTTGLKKRGEKNKRMPKKRGLQGDKWKEQFNKSRQRSGGHFKVLKALRWWISQTPTAQCFGKTAVGLRHMGGSGWQHMWIMHLSVWQDVFHPADGPLGSSKHLFSASWKVRESISPLSRGKRWAVKSQLLRFGFPAGWVRWGEARMHCHT